MISPMRRIRVLYVIGSLGVGGAEGHLVQLIKHLDRERFEPVVACMSELGPLAPDLQALGVPVHLYGLKGLRRRPPWDIVRRVLSIAGHVRGLAPDIVHTYLYHANVLCGLMSKLGGSPLLITSRRGLGLFKDGKPYYQWLENFTNLFTAAITVNSKGVKEDVLQREAWVRNKLHLIYNGVEFNRFAVPATSPAAFKSQLGIPVEAPVVGCVANLIPYKGHADLLEAMAIVARVFPECHLVLVGRDDGIQALLSTQAADLGIGDKIHFLGSRRDINDCLQAMDVQVLASHEEGFSNVILEGMAAGRPIVATDVGGNAEAVLHGVTGLVVPSHKADQLATGIITLLNDPEMRSRLGKAAMERAATTFSVDAMVEHVQRLYEQLLQRR